MERPAPTRLRLLLDPAAEATARDLAARETQCCSFFEFGFSLAGDSVAMDVTVPPARTDVLAELAARAAAAGDA